MLRAQVAIGVADEVEEDGCGLLRVLDGWDYGSGVTERDPRKMLGLWPLA